MNITIIRNTAQTLTFTKTGDYSGDTVKFTVKADKTLTSSRLIDKSASVSYANAVSTITVSLLPSDSALLSADNYYYDLRVENDSSDRELLEGGLAYIDKSVRNDTDGSTVSIPDADISAFKTLLGIPELYRGKAVITGGLLSPTIENTEIQNDITGYSDGAVSRYAAGNYQITLPEAYSGNNLEVNFHINSLTGVAAEEYQVHFPTSGDTVAIILVYKSGVLADLDNEDILSVTYAIRKYA